MDWDGLEAVCGPSGAAEVHLRASSTSLQNCGVAVALAHNNPMVLPKIPPPPPPPKAIQQAQRILNHHTTSPRRPDLIVVDRRHSNPISIMKPTQYHDRQLQSTQA